MTKPRKIIKLLNSLVEFPCLSCGAITPENDNSLCPQCKSDLQIIPTPRCSGCGGTVDGILELCSHCLSVGGRPWDEARSAYLYSGSLQRLIIQLKYYRRIENAQLLGEFAFKELNRFQNSFDCIVPVPLHLIRRLQRGFNQSQLIAQELSILSGLPINNALRRVKYLGHQASRDRKERLLMMRSVFKLRKNIDLTGKSVLLLDDVFTTGATLSAAAIALQDANPDYIGVLTLGIRL